MNKILFSCGILILPTTILAMTVKQPSIDHRHPVNREICPIFMDYSEGKEQETISSLCNYWKNYWNNWGYTNISTDLERRFREGMKEFLYAWNLLKKNKQEPALRLYLPDEMQIHACLFYHWEHLACVLQEQNATGYENALRMRWGKLPGTTEVPSKNSYAEICTEAKASSQLSQEKIIASR